jgi:hypothetical protein
MIPRLLLQNLSPYSSLGNASDKTEIVLWAIAASAMIFVGLVVLLLLRRGMQKSGQGADIDMRFLDKMSSELTPEELKRVREATLRRMLEREKKSKPKTSVEDLSMLLTTGAIKESASPESPAPAPPATSQAGVPAPSPSPAPPVQATPAPTARAAVSTPPAPDASPKKTVTRLADILRPAKDIEEAMRTGAASGDSLESPVPAATEASPVVEPTEAPAPSTHQKVDIDFLLEKGLISRADYDKIKAALESGKEGGGAS